jgi:hypothetical protein
MVNELSTAIHKVNDIKACEKILSRAKNNEEGQLRRAGSETHRITAIEEKDKTNLKQNVGLGGTSFLPYNELRCSPTTKRQSLSNEKTQLSRKKHLSRKFFQILIQSAQAPHTKLCRAGKSNPGPAWVGSPLAAYRQSPCVSLIPGTRSKYCQYNSCESLLRDWWKDGGMAIS